MVTQTKTEARFEDIQKMTKGLLSKPITKMTTQELSILPVALTFGDTFYRKEHEVEINVRDLHGKHSAKSLTHLCDMLCVVESYNSYDPKTVCDVLEEHKDFINFDETSFGREYSPVLYLSLKNTTAKMGQTSSWKRRKPWQKTYEKSASVTNFSGVFLALQMVILMKTYHSRCGALCEMVKKSLGTKKKHSTTSASSEFGGINKMTGYSRHLKFLNEFQQRSNKPCTK